ncbi:hypothetical protein FRC04_011835 [Tulasnella sp. 424]|nr:hypothetical protein FRC04_011835 [Tulasnella sp. 424]
MASTSLPFRVYLGSYRGDHSLVVHSSKGVDCADNKPPRHFITLRPPVANVLLPQGVGYPTARDINFVELGCSLDNFVIKVGSKVVLGRHKGIQGLIANDETGNDQIVVRLQSPSSCVKPDLSLNPEAAALSPLDNSHYFVMFEDGSYSSSLPKALGKIVKRHLPQVESPSPHDDEEFSIPFPLWLLSRVAGGSSFRVPPLSTSSTQLRRLHQLDSERERGNVNLS